ncbi:unnamed protein product [Urochloa humidicola]
MASTEEKLERLIDEIKSIQMVQIKTTERVEAIHTRVEGIHKWSLEADHLASGLTKDINDLKSCMKTFDEFFKSTPKVPPRKEDGRASGHHVETNHQGADVGTHLPHHALVKGEPTISNSGFQFLEAPESSDRHVNSVANQYGHKDLKLPKLDFPKFHGDNPRVWRDKCEKYFSMYDVPVHMWVSFATINFKGNAELWLQSYEAQHSIESWPDLCVALEQKFGRDLYQNDMRDMLNLRQTSDVLEYADRFEKAKHKVLVHNKDMGEVFFVQKFLDGLKYNIRSTIALHRPRTVDGALSLALMQEQLLEASTRRYNSRAREYSKSAIKANVAGNSGGSSILGPTPVVNKTTSDKT